MTGQPHVAVLKGGSSPEADVSRVSAAGVADSLREAQYQVTELELDRNLPGHLIRLAPDAVFPVLHGCPGEDGTAQGLLDLLELPYVGGGVQACAIAMDKPAAKAAFRRAGLPVAAEVVLAPGEVTTNTVDRIIAELGDQLVVKPSALGSAMGISRLPTRAGLAAALTLAMQTGSVLVEPFLPGREVTVGILDLHGEAPLALPSIEIRTPGGWYDTANRYQAGASEHIIPADLADAVNAELQRIALAAHQALGLRDLSRTDMIVGEAGTIHLLEVNAMPGMTPTSLYPDAAAAIGVSAPDLMDRLVQSALARSAEGEA